ncbi:hypothetical protein LSAT2_003152 [Lamellibrachia satsuma]|nr:hypothetical protein LSAT2_003152 [Lamellibrachia satsuma]
MLIGLRLRVLHKLFWVPDLLFMREIGKGVEITATDPTTSPRSIFTVATQKPRLQPRTKISGIAITAITVIFLAVVGGFCWKMSTSANTDILEAEEGQSFVESDALGRRQTNHPSNPMTLSRQSKYDELTHVSFFSNFHRVIPVTRQRATLLTKHRPISFKTIMASNSACCFPHGKCHLIHHG